MREIMCRLCQQSLPIDRFFPSWITASTRISRCRSCAADRARQWESDNPGYRTTANHKPINKQWRKLHRTQLSIQVNEWRRRNPDRWRTIARRSRIKTMDKVLFRNRQREILKLTAMPQWADKVKIQAIYEEAKRLTRETGIRHEVDHIYPLRGKTSCGLHVEYNLRIITGAENRKKFNHLLEEVSP